MRTLFTGGSSPLGARVLHCVLDDERNTEVWCGVHRRPLTIDHPKLRPIKVDLENAIDLSEIPAPLDQVIHFAAATHSQHEQDYWNLNFRATKSLAEQARSRGCRRFAYVSTRCATMGSGAYGESKLAAEAELLKLDWNSLLIIRPAEIYGGLGSEGVDKLLQLAKRFRVVPMLWGDRRLRFAPLHIDDFVAATCALLQKRRNGVEVLEVCGPEILSGATLAWRIAQKSPALPIPLWWPAVSVSLSLLRGVGVNPAPQEQIKRLLGSKTAEHSTLDQALIKPMRRFLRDST